MILLPISPSDKEAAHQLYLESFPEHERVPPEKLEAHLHRGDAEWLGIYDHGFRGMVYRIFNRDVLFILYLAVDPSFRDTGYGSSAIEAVLERHPGRKTYLNIEPPDDDAGTGSNASEGWSSMSGTDSSPVRSVGPPTAYS